MLTITGSYFDDEISCLFGEPPAVQLQIMPILIDSTHIVCPMSQYFVTDTTPIWLDLWNGIRQIDTGCTYFYYRDVVIDYMGPDHLSIYAHDNGVIVEIEGFNFREDDRDGRSLQARIDEEILPDQVEFLNENFLKIKPRNMPKEGPQSVYISNNYGVSWQRSSSFISLKYHLPP